MLRKRGEPARVTPSPRRIVVDLETTLEGGLVLVGCFGLVLAFCLGLDFLNHPGRWAHGTTRWVFVGLAVLAPVSWALRWLLDEHYLLDLDERKLFFHRGFAGHKSVTPVASFEQCLAFAVQGSYQSSRYSSWWEYSPVLVTRDKRILRLADAGRDDEGLEQAIERAREMSELTGVAFHPAEAQRILTVVAPGPTLTYIPRKTPWTLIIAIICFSLAFGVGLVYFFGGQ